MAAADNGRNTKLAIGAGVMIVAACAILYFSMAGQPQPGTPLPPDPAPAGGAGKPGAAPAAPKERPPDWSPTRITPKPSGN